MKKLSFIVGLFIVIVLYACNKPVEVTPSKGSAIFSYTNKETNIGGRVSDALMIPAFILLSIEDSNGKEILRDKKLSLQTFGESYISQAIELGHGSYQLTKFLVLNDKDTVIYATPLEGTDIAQYVDDPLPVNFAITQDKETQVSLQVLSLGNEDKKLSYYISYREVEVVGTGIIEQPESRVYYNYKLNGQLEYIRYELYNAQTLLFEESFTETFTYEDAKVSKIVGTRNGKYFKELNYTYDTHNKIVETNLNSGITTTMLFTTSDIDNHVQVTFTFSNGNSFLYEFDTHLNNIVRDKTTKGGQLCSNGVFTFDKNINPFRSLAYTDINFRNWSANNKLTEQTDYLACSFPTLIPALHEYTYDMDGYPIEQITSYKSGWEPNDPISPYHSKVKFFYE
jgi:hypothetical protein